MGANSLIRVNGLDLVTPTSVAKTGTGSTATINTNGSVSFSSCTTLSLNGVFTSTYRNYMVVTRVTSADTSVSVVVNLRASGVNAGGTTDYNYQVYNINGTSETTSNVGILGYWPIYISSTITGGAIVYFYNPQRSEPSAARAISMNTNGPSIVEYAMNHELSTSYDGFTLSPLTSSMTGLVCVYGLVF